MNRRMRSGLATASTATAIAARIAGSTKIRSLTPEMAYLLEGLCKAKINMIISGGTGAGKTTLLNILSGYIPPQERIVTIEDAAELQLQQPHVVRMETRPMNIEGKGEITQRSLVQPGVQVVTAGVHVLTPGQKVSVWQEP